MMRTRLARLALSVRIPRRGLSTRSTNVLDELEGRGLVQAVTSPELRTHLNAPSVVYAGVDPSAPSLHVGNLLPLMGLLHFRARGHHALALIGGATGAIGDPSGRSTERNALSPDALAHNIAGITAQVERFFERGTEYAAKRGYGVAEGQEQGQQPSVLGVSDEERARGFSVVNNHDWFKDVTFLDFLRDVGKLARVNVMLARDSVKSRLNSDQGISFTEFSYQLLQAHDFSTLYDRHACRIQLGGSDQWGNIVAGIDLIKRARAQRAAEAAAEQASADAEGKDDGGAAAAAAAEAAAAAAGEGADPAFGITMPLLTTSSGEKFGKSAGNAVWLDEARTSVSDFYQFFYRATDADVGKYLSVLTLVPPDEIRHTLAEHNEAPGARVAQKFLAREVTELVHGPAAVRRAETIAAIMFSPDPRKHLKSDQVLDAMAGDPRLVRIPRRDLKGAPVSKLAVVHGLCKSRADANRIIKKHNTGMHINDLGVHDPRREINRSDLIDGHIAILRRGKKDMVVFYVDFPE